MLQLTAKEKAQKTKSKEVDHRQAATELQEASLETREGGRKAEAIAATEAAKEMLWMKRFLLELGVRQDEYVVFCDSQSAMDLSKNATYHSRTKHIDVRYHWLRDVVDKQSNLS